jgi:hypothetical protein
MPIGPGLCAPTTSGRWPWSASRCTIPEFLACHRGALSELSDLAGVFTEWGLIHSYSVSSELALEEGEPALLIELGMRGPEDEEIEW